MRHIARMVRSRGFGVGVLLLAFAWLWHTTTPWGTADPSGPAAAPQTPTAVIAQAQATLFPEGEAAWSGTVSLPFRWDDHHPSRGGRAELELVLPPSPDAHHRGLWMPRVGNQAEVRSVDGALLARWGDLHDPGFDAVKAPRLVLLPPAVVQSGRVRVVLTAQPARFGGLGPVHWGEAAALEPLHQGRLDWRQFSSMAIVANFVLLLMLSTGVWWFRRDPLALDLAFGSAAGTLVYAARILEQPPLPWPMWGAAVAVAIWVHLALFFSALTRVFELYAGWMHPRLVYASLVVGAAMPVVAFAAALPALWTFALFCTTPFTAWALYQIGRKVWLYRRPVHAAVLLVLLAIFATASWDLVAGRLLGDGVGTLQLAPVSTFLAIMVFGFLLVNRQVAPSSALEAARRSERERIMRDLHDGVGGHLLGLRALVAQGAVTGATLMDEVDSALEDMRLTVDALQPSGSDLSTLLATLRYRMQSRFDAAGIRVAWHIPELKADLGLPPEQVFHVQKILMEALANVQKHSGATQVWVHLDVPSAATQRSHALIVIEDNGKGPPSLPAQGTGWGLKTCRPGPS
jgi:signal transduction histidine kinase